MVRLLVTDARAGGGASGDCGAVVVHIRMQTELAQSWWGYWWLMPVLVVVLVVIVLLLVVQLGHLLIIGCSIVIPCPS